MSDAADPINLLRAQVGATALPPYVELGEWPTPVSPMAGFSDRIGAEVWVKRDDLTGRAYGGNKVRKLEFLLGEAVSHRCRDIVTVGGIGSNHLIATAVYGRKLGMRTHAVVFPQPVTTKVRAGLQLLCDLDVRFHPVSVRPLVPLGVARARREAPGALFIPPGGSSSRGVLGYVCAGLEIAAQVRSGLMPHPDAVFAPLGTGGTVCGLMLGFALAGLGTVVHCVRVVEAIYVNEAVVRLLLGRTVKLLNRMGASLDPSIALTMPVSVVHDQMGPGYGHPTRQATEAVRCILDTESIKLETTYSGKALASLVEMCRGPLAGKRVLFVDTFNSRSLDALRADLETRPVPPPLDDWITAEPIEIS